MRARSRFKKIKKSTLFNKIRSYFKRDLKLKLFWSLFYASARIICSLAWPYLLYRQLFKDEQIETDLIIYIVPIVLIIFALSQWFSYIQTKINTQINDYLSLHLTSDFWHKMISLEWLSFKSKPRNYYFNVFLVDFWRIRHGIKAFLEIILPYSFMSMALILFLLYISPRIFILYLIGFVFTTVFQLLSNLKLRPVIRMFHQAWINQSKNVGISVDKYDLIRMERGYNKTFDLFKKDSKKFLSSNSTMLLTQAKWKIYIQVIIQIASFAILFIGIYWINKGFLSWGDFFFTIFVIGIIQSNLIQLPNGINLILEALESFNRINDYFKLDSESLNKTADSKIEIDTINSIEIDSLNFGYPEKEGLFDNFKLSLEKGKVYLWRGPNGCGKSTLSHILLGLIEPTSGELKINNSDFDWQKLKQIRNKFAFIHQDALLFSGSIKDNITFGQESPHKLWNKVKDSWMSGLLPSGIPDPDRIIGERGEGLSGGEAKRLILIREWLHAAKLIVFDEPLNHLDSASVDYVVNEIKSYKKNAIIVIISHQKGFESVSDEIIEINKNKWNKNV